MMPIFEVRASTGHRIFVDANEPADAVAIARQRWARFGIVPTAINASIPTLPYAAHAARVGLQR